MTYCNNNNSLSFPQHPHCRFSVLCTLDKKVLMKNALIFFSLFSNCFKKNVRWFNFKYTHNRNYYLDVKVKPQLSREE